QLLYSTALITSLVSAHGPSMTEATKQSVTACKALALPSREPIGLDQMIPSGAMAFYEHGYATKWWPISALVLRVYGDLTCFACGCLSMRLLRQQRAMMSAFTYRISIQYTRALLVQ
ncbi:hypothetical protein AAVH_30445, partial [Aphelenchoides avenae]